MIVGEAGVGMMYTPTTGGYTEVRRGDDRLHNFVARSKPNVSVKKWGFPADLTEEEFQRLFESSAQCVVEGTEQNSSLYPIIVYTYDGDPVAWIDVERLEAYVHSCLE